MTTPSIKRCSDMYKILEELMKLYEITPEKYKPYLISFIKNETYEIPNRIDAILRAIKDKTYAPVFQKRNFKFLGDINNEDKINNS